MDENPKPESSLADELRLLGHNLKETLLSAWESDERAKVQQEIENGLEELGQLLKDAAEEFQSSAISTEIRESVQDFRERLERGEVESRVREDLMGALKTMNAELTRIKEQWISDPAEPPAGKPGVNDG